MANLNNNAKLIVLDTDVGIDDACALLLLLKKHQRPTNVLAVTTVRGNAGVDQVCLNVLRVLKLAGRLDIPVYRGCDVSYIGTRESSSEFYHGSDGLGDVPDPTSPDASHVQPEHASLALIRLVNQYPGQISLVCLAPLTNIAVALKLDPNFGRKLHDCFIMGGNYTGKGNITCSAEFNFYCDPEAADVVLRQLQCPITLVTWEACLTFSSSWEWFAKFSSVDTARGRFVRSIVLKSHESYYSGGQSSIEDRQQYITCDELAAAVAVDDRVVTEVKKVKIHCVDTSGRMTRGQVVIDWIASNETTDKDNRCVLQLLTGIDQDLYERLLLDALVDD